MQKGKLFINFLFLIIILGFYFGFFNININEKLAFANLNLNLGITNQILIIVIVLLFIIDSFLRIIPLQPLILSVLILLLFNNWLFAVIFFVIYSILHKMFSKKKDDIK